MRFRKTEVCYAVQLALAKQMDEAIAKAELEEAQARQEQMAKAMVDSLDGVGKRFGLGLVDRFKPVLNRLRGRA